MYPALYELQRQGDYALQAYTLEGGNRIEDKFWSLHCYRRGARSFVSMASVLGDHRFLKATITQVYVHARWTPTKRSNEAIDKQYLKWTLWQRLQITLRCQ